VAGVGKTGDTPGFCFGEEFDHLLLFCSCFSFMYGSTALVKINRFVHHKGEILTQLKSMGGFFPLTSPEPGFQPK